MQKSPRRHTESIATPYRNNLKENLLREKNYFEDRRWETQITAPMGGSAVSAAAPHLAFAALAPEEDRKRQALL